jgi:FdhD protein
MQVWRHGPDGASRDDDDVAIEEPLQIRLAWRQAGALLDRPIAVTMRTPGHDAELALGFLLAEGVIAGRAAVEQPAPDTVRVLLPDGAEPDLMALERHVLTSSACGVCGRVTLDGLHPHGPDLSADPALLPAAFISSLPARLLAAQPGFSRTGGLHAAGLFAPDGALRVAREDVGRHNALDKVIGHAVDLLPLHGHAVCVSGRASFELVQKASQAGVPALIAVGAPSSLAVRLAAERGMTLVGFCRGTTFNVYTGAHRVLPG